MSLIMVFSWKESGRDCPETGSSTSQRSRQGSTDGRQDASVQGTRRP
jgi:hypothetical protein